MQDFPWNRAYISAAREQSSECSGNSELTVFSWSMSPNELISCPQIQLSRINGRLLGTDPKEMVQGENSQKALSFG